MTSISNPQLYSKKGVILSLLMIGLLACGEVSGPEELTGPGEESVLLRDPVDYYSKELTRLDTLDPESIGKACGLFQNVFIGSDPPVCDSGFLAFNELFDKIAWLTGEEYLKMIRDADSVFTEQGKIELPEAINAYRIKLNSNGLNVDTLGGSVTIRKDLDYILRNFHPYLSDCAKTYLNFMKESDDSSTQDGSLFDPEKCAPRIVWIQEFLNDYRNCVYTPYVKKRQNEMLSVMINGLVTGSERKNFLVRLNICLNRSFPDKQVTKLFNRHYRQMLNEERISEEFIRELTEEKVDSKHYSKVIL